jgi:hypothetical protein
VGGRHWNANGHTDVGSIPAGEVLLEGLGHGVLQQPVGVGAVAPTRVERQVRIGVLNHETRLLTPGRGWYSSPTTATETLVPGLQEV